MQRVTILGAGSWGTALCTLLTSVPRVELWTHEAEHSGAMLSSHRNERYLPGVTLPANVHPTHDLRRALDESDCVIFAVPSAAMREVSALAAPHIPVSALLVSAAKGLEDITGFRMSQVIADAVCAGAPDDPRLAVLSGPNLAVEVARGIPTCTVAASASLDAARACQRLWMGPSFRVYTSSDVVGVELAGAMKNVIAIGAGVCEGIRYGDNSRAALMTRGLAEITRLGAALGAQPSTFLGLAGVGDLIATGGSRLSRNYRVGVGLGAGKALAQVLDEIGQVAEGVPTTRAICHLARKLGVDMPISEALYAALFEGAAIGDAIKNLMMRPPRGETDL